MKKVKNEFFTFAKCQYCLFWFPKELMCYDHFIPKSLYGTDDDKNLILCCYFCNFSKGAKLFNNIESVRVYRKPSEEISKKDSLRYLTEYGLAKKIMKQIINLTFVLLSYILLS